jgi:hypothetical protein
VGTLVFLFSSNVLPAKLNLSLADAANQTPTAKKANAMRIKAASVYFIL